MNNMLLTVPNPGGKPSAHPKMSTANPITCVVWPKLISIIFIIPIWRTPHALNPKSALSIMTAPSAKRNNPK